ncbi:MAG: zf-HC2 domain-containing protein [Candidatus Latescibacteria bacterium]|nr:zf-HC2 domain-containing protein [Candidatus Latescibacterota bacterium]
MLAQFLDGELEHARSEDLERHLEVCRSCCSRAEFERVLKTQLAGVGRRNVEPAFVERIRQLIGELPGRPSKDPPAR